MSAPASEAPVAGEPSTIDDPELRGTLHIAHAVVRKVAQRAANDAPGTAPARHGATVRVNGGEHDVELSLGLAVVYPEPVGPVVDTVRKRVITDVERITSYRVRDVDVTVSALVPDVPPRVR